MDFRILIVEDELIIAHHIAEVLAGKGYENTRIVKSFEAAKYELEEFLPQLILSDIMLGSNADGIELGKLIHTKYKIPFIYITSHGSLDMIREASKTMPNAYLVKPFKTPDLLAAIELALYSNPANSANSNSANNLVWIKGGSGLIQFQKNEVMFLKAQENYTGICTSDNKIKMVRQFLGEVHSLFPEENFIRVHKSYVINLNHVREVKSGIIHMSEQEVPLGRTYKTDLLKALEGNPAN